VNAGVGLVRAYLQLNGYFTSAEFAVIAGRRDGRFEEITDLDLLAVRLPLALHVISRGRPGPEDDLRMETDRLLEPSAEAVDVIVAEVKEGKARLNEAARSSRALYTALHRVGCVPPERVDSVVQELARSGEARLSRSEAPIPSRIRLVAFGEGETGHRDGYRVISLAHVADFVGGYLDRYHTVLRPADLSDPVLGLLHLLRKLE
jgi:hypothetical protein